MRLKAIYISHYKNLNDFQLQFNSDSFVDVFVGKNGTGKSNLFEALIEIFHHLYEFDESRYSLNFDYQITYEINNREIQIEFSAY